MCAEGKWCAEGRFMQSEMREKQKIRITFVYKEKLFSYILEIIGDFLLVIRIVCLVVWWTSRQVADGGCLRNGCIQCQRFIQISDLLRCHQIRVWDFVIVYAPEQFEVGLAAANDVIQYL